MLTLHLLGALLVLAGLVYMAWRAINRGRMSDPAPNPPTTLEPAHRGLRFLSWKVNWPGLLMMALGALLLLLPF
jgi:hypothetical protein